MTATFNFYHIREPTEGQKICGGKSLKLYTIPDEYDTLLDCVQVTFSTVVQEVRLKPKCEKCKR